MKKNNLVAEIVVSNLQQYISEQEELREYGLPVYGKHLLKMEDIVLQEIKYMFTKEQMMDFALKYHQGELCVDLPEAFKQYSENDE